jgi:hypothetical protein
MTPEGVGEQQDASSAPDEVEGSLEGGILRNREHDGIGAALARPFVDPLRKSRIPTVPGGCRSPGSAEFPSAFDEIRPEHLLSREFEKAVEEESDRPLSDDHDRITALQVEATDGFQDGVDRFQQGAFLEGVAGWDPNDAREAERKHLHVFRVATACGFESRGDSGPEIGGALGEVVVSTEVAGSAGHVMVECHAIPHAVAGHPGADPHHRSSGLVAEDSWGWHRPGLDLFDVRRAHPADGDPDQEFLSADPRDGDFLDAEIVGSPVDDRPHHAGNPWFHA